MAHLTIFDKLPEDVVDLIEQLRKKGRTISEIHAKLVELDVDVSRSAVGRHIKNFDFVTARFRETKKMAASFVKDFGQETDATMLRMNIELLQPAIMGVLMGEDGAGANLDAKECGQVAKALKDVAAARALDAARQLKEMAEFKKLAAKTAEKVAKAHGLTSETVNAIKSAILGVEIPKAKPAGQ